MWVLQSYVMLVGRNLIVILIGIIFINFINLEQMSELNKRGLRERNKKNLFGDEMEEDQMNGYGRSYNKQIYNPSLQLNLDAKLMIKFINVINKKFIQNNQEKPKPEIKTNTRQNLNQSSTQKAAVSNKSNLNKTNYVKNTNPAPVKKNTNSTSYNGVNQSINYNKSIKNQDYLNKIKAMSQQSASSMLQLQKSLNKNIQSNSQSTQKMPPASLKNKQQNKNGFSFNGEKFKANNYQIKSFVVPTSGQIQSVKKATIHIWISHFIYRNTSKKGSDPTMAARKLKQKTFKNK